MALVTGVYLICYGLLSVLDGLLEEKPGLQSMIWGFHYLIALIIAVAVRQIQMRFFKVQNDTQSLTQVANLSVDWVTCAAIAAIQIHVLSQNWLPILLLSAVGLVVTLLLVLWWSSRGFTQDKAEHAIVWFGASTGTLPMGLALLRMVDPSLKSTAPSSVALGSMVSLVASIPLLLVIMPYVIDNYPEGTLGLHSNHWRAGLVLCGGVCDLVAHGAIFAHSPSQTLAHLKRFLIGSRLEMLNVQLNHRIRVLPVKRFWIGCDRWNVLLKCGIV